MRFYPGCLPYMKIKLQASRVIKKRKFLLTSDDGEKFSLLKQIFGVPFYVDYKSKSW